MRNKSHRATPAEEGENAWKREVGHDVLSIHKVAITYGKKLQEARRQSRRIERGLNDHQERQSQSPRNYGWTGDLNHIINLLSDVADFLNKTSNSPSSNWIY